MIEDNFFQHFKSLFQRHFFVTGFFEFLIPRAGQKSRADPFFARTRLIFRFLEIKHTEKPLFIRL